MLWTRQPGQVRSSSLFQPERLPPARGLCSNVILRRSGDIVQIRAAPAFYLPPKPGVIDVFSLPYKPTFPTTGWLSFTLEVFYAYLSMCTMFCGYWGTVGGRVSSARRCVHRLGFGG